MQSFKDDAGRDWELNLGITAMGKIRGRGINLLDNDQLQAALADPLIVCDVIWWLCEDQAAQRETGKDTFYENLLIGNTFENASDGLLEELGDFFTKTGKRLLAEMIRATLKARPQISQAMNRQAPKMETMVAGMIKKAEEELNAALTLTAGN